MSIIRETDNGLTYSIRDELLCIEAYGEDCIRVRSTRNSTLSDEKWALLDAEECASKENYYRFGIRTFRLDERCFRIWLSCANA